MNEVRKKRLLELALIVRESVDNQPFDDDDKERQSLFLLRSWRDMITRADSGKCGPVNGYCARLMRIAAAVLWRGLENLEDERAKELGLK